MRQASKAGEVLARPEVPTAEVRPGRKGPIVGHCHSQTRTTDLGSTLGMHTRPKIRVIQAIVTVSVLSSRIKTPG